jgi:hypothetical protein
MGKDGTRLDQGSAGGIPLAEAFHVLDRLRIDIDRRLVNMVPEDPARPELWQELEEVLQGLHQTVRDLADAPAVDLADLQAKAAILATLLRSEIGGGGQVIADAERTALAVSITDDIASLSDG